MFHQHAYKTTSPRDMHSDSASQTSTYINHANTDTNSDTVTPYGLEDGSYTKKPLNRTYGRQGSYEVGGLDSNGQIIGPTSAGIAIRWILMILHVILTLLTFILSMIFFGGFIHIIIHGAMVIVMLVYIPTAMILTGKRSPSRFQQAGGEVAYLAVQQFGWLVGAILNILYLVQYRCGTPRIGSSNSINGSLYIGQQACTWVGATCDLSFAHVVLLMGWMIWVIVLTQKKGRENRCRAFGVSVAWLLRDWHA